MAKTWYEIHQDYLAKLKATKRAASELESAAKAAGDEIGETLASVIRLRITLTIERNTLYADKEQGNGR